MSIRLEIHTYNCSPKTLGEAGSKHRMNEYKTSDLATAAYLHMKGIPLIKADSLSNGRFIFVFDDTDSSCTMLSYEFINSECSKYDNHVRMLKKMIYKN
ncbi:DUF5659 domain-containing protein [bacterium]|nr:DUF5659 domain-containing protein [bacterium]